ncbi:Protein phosphatase 2C 4 [Sphaceloma murrayae]|uniref:Protein phosphatase 2C 4 n=1 Tax=Sphaceloma murrayae TaxID=2082308 RepID=A0A2K1QRS6_9PEZI|nr:Protein phosphatase 2C 4 [Sphaceloma murrayae]
MRFLHLALILPSLVLAQQIPLTNPQARNTTISPALFTTLEEHARLVDIAYCVGATGTGISKPFTCLSRCSSFPSFTLVTTWNTGPLLSDSCGYIALSDAPANKRIIVAFRGTYSLANTVLDLATVRQEYVPYPAGGEDECEGCKAHMGFMRAWELTREVVLPHVTALRASHPEHELTLIGHSLGGAVAALAGLEFEGRGWAPRVTTFGEPRVGNEELAGYFGDKFGLRDGRLGEETAGSRYRRVTHVDDPVPLLPLSEWGYAAHAGEIFITKSELSPEIDDLRSCSGSADMDCIAGQDESLTAVLLQPVEGEPDMALSDSIKAMAHESKTGFGFPSRYKLWQLLFAHRDYFWRLGLCVPALHPEL